MLVQKVTVLVTSFPINQTEGESQSNRVWRGRTDFGSWALIIFVCQLIKLAPQAFLYKKTPHISCLVEIVSLQLNVWKHLCQMFFSQLSGIAMPYLFDRIISQCVALLSSLMIINRTHPSSGFNFWDDDAHAMHSPQTLLHFSSSLKHDSDWCSSSWLWLAVFDWHLYPSTENAVSGKARFTCIIH